MPVCLKCGYELVFGPAGCACTQAARRERESEEATRSMERVAKIIEGLNKPNMDVPMPAPADFEYAAVNKILAAASRYQLDLVGEAMRLATGKVTAIHVDQAIRNLRKDL